MAFFRYIQLSAKMQAAVIFLMKGVSLLNYESYQRKEIERKRKVKKNCDTIFRYVRRYRRFPLRP